MGERGPLVGVWESEDGISYREGPPFRIQCKGGGEREREMKRERERRRSHT